MKLAWFTPRTAKSAVATFSKHVCQELSFHCDVDLWLDGPFDCRETFLRSIDYVKAPEALDDLTDYDAVIYNIGDNVKYHGLIHQVSRRYAGHVILHDKVLRHLFADYCAFWRRNSAAYVDLIAYYYGDEGREAAERELREHAAGGLGDDGHDLIRFPLLEEAIVNAVGVVVHSSDHAQLVNARWFGPVKTLHLPCYDPDVSAKSRAVADVPWAPDERIMLLTVGVVNPNKRIHDVIEALGRNEGLASRTSYVVVGEAGASKAYVDHLAALVNEHSLQDTVKLVGYQSDDVVTSYLRSADIIVNLRYPAMEGCSATLMEQLPWGKPVLVTDTGSYAELPDAAVVKVRPGGDDIARELAKLVDDPALRTRIGEAGQRLSRSYSVEHYATELIHFLEASRKWQPLLGLCNRIGAELGVFGTDAAATTIGTVATELPVFVTDRAAALLLAPAAADFRDRPPARHVA